MNKLGFAILVFSIFVTSCEDPAANKTRAVTADALNSASTPSSSTRSENVQTLPITSENSHVRFTGSKVTGKHEGGFNRFTGSIDLVNGKIEDSRVKIEIETASVFTDTDGLTKHLQSQDFFLVERYPEATFESTSITPNTATGPDNFSVTGNLELRGVKKSITFPATITVTPSEVSVDSEFSINRKDFGILYPGKADDLIRDDVVLTLEVRAPRKN